MMNSEVQQAHVLERTNAFGAPFVGRCTLCGKTGLRMAQANEACANPARIRADHALLAAIEGEEAVDG